MKEWEYLDGECHSTSSLSIETTTSVLETQYAEIQAGMQAAFCRVFKK